MHELNLAAAAKAQKWAKQRPALLEQEVAEMAAHFPHWQLGMSEAGTLLGCPTCQLPYGFSKAGASKPTCPRCGRELKKEGVAALCWYGYLPTMLRPRAAVKVQRQIVPSHPLIRVGRNLWLLAPLLLSYPAEWPSYPPIVQYDPRIFTLLKVAATTSNHVVGNNQLCLYSGGGWRQVTARVVLQQRVANHLASLIRVASGQASAEAFIGPAHGNGGEYDPYYER